MNIDRQWEMARNALFRFITAIPEGDEVGIVSFGANARINIEPTEVTASNREGLYGRVPFRLLNGQQGCLECGLRMALKLLDSPRAVSNGALVVLTATPGKFTEYFFFEYLSLRKFVCIEILLLLNATRIHKNTKYSRKFTNLYEYSKCQNNTLPDIKVFLIKTHQYITLY